MCIHFLQSRDIMPSASLSYFLHYEPQVFRFWSQLNENQKERLADQLKHLKIDVLKKQQADIQDPCEQIDTSYEPFDTFSFSGNLNHRKMGEKLIEEGRLGCLLLAGGEGTRLQHVGPKGTYPISIIKHKSLFELCAEKIKAAAIKAGRSLNLAIMTSPDNDAQTRAFFHSHHFFGLEPSCVFFFIQEKLPFLDSAGRLFLETHAKVAEGADGNGHSLLHFSQSGILNEWIKQGIHYLHMILVDNPLADPFDAELLGFHSEQQADITLKCTEKVDPDEKVGLLVKQKRGCKVVEYSEMSELEKKARRPDGGLKHCCANLSLFCFSLAFIEQMVKRQQHLPLHKAWKASSYVDQDGHVHHSREPNAWKFERFVFDWLLFAEKVSALIYPRDECFAPLKNSKGADSPSTVRAAIQKRDRALIEKITGLPAPSFPFELSAEFYYASGDILKKWKGQKIVSSYMTP